MVFHALLAVSPIATLLALMIGVRWSTQRSSALAWLCPIAITLSFFCWIPIPDEAYAGGFRPVISELIRHQAEAVGCAHGLAAAEEYRVQRFGAPDSWFEASSISC